MGLMASRQLNVGELMSYQDATGLSIEQLEQLHYRFRALDRHQRGYLTPTELLRIPQLTQNPMHRQIIDGFFGKADGATLTTRSTSTPTDNIDFGQFVRICATFLVPQFVAHLPPHQRPNGRAQKLRLLTTMFDTQRHGCIYRSDFRKAMKCLLDSVPPSDSLANVYPQSSETELQLLEELAFGSGNCITYDEFEQRLATTDVDSRLSVNKWLDEGEEQQNAIDRANDSGT